MNDPVHENVGEAYPKCVDEIEDSPEGYYLPAGREADAMPIGAYCTFPEDGNYDIGYCVAEEYWGEGLGIEAVDATLRWVKAKSGKPVTGGVANGNLLSITPLHRFGFTEDRKTCYKKWGGKTYFDAHHYKLNSDGLPIPLWC